jgi:hypothetical protein
MLILFVGLRNRHTSKTQKWRRKKSSALSFEVKNRNPTNKISVALLIDILRERVHQLQWPGMHRGSVLLGHRLTWHRRGPWLVQNLKIGCECQGDFGDGQFYLSHIRIWFIWLATLSHSGLLSLRRDRMDSIGSSVAKWVYNVGIVMGAHCLAALSTSTC